MKKIICLTCAVLMLLSFASCGKDGKTADPDGAAVNSQVVNPMESVSAEQATTALGLREFTLPEGYTAGEITKYKGTPEIYSFDVTCQSLCCNVRVAKADENSDCDISGIFMSGEPEAAIYDSADIGVQPSIAVESDGEYIKSYCEWNGFFFAISAEDSGTDNDDFYTLSVNIAKALISTDNIA